jgi:hypothetical protein
MTSFTRTIGGRSVARVSLGFPGEASRERRFLLCGVLAVVALGAGVASGASAQTGGVALTKSAPFVAATSAPEAALVTRLDEQLQHLVTNSASEREHLAARIVGLCDGLAQMEGSPADKIEAGYVIAASLYMQSEFPAAKAALMRAAEFATARGEVFDAANRYLDVVVLTSRQPVRTPENVQEARAYYARARALGSSSLLSAEQRAFLLKRFE